MLFRFGMTNFTEIISKQTCTARLRRLRYRSDAVQLVSGKTRDTARCPGIRVGTITEIGDAEARASIDLCGQVSAESSVESSDGVGLQNGSATNTHVCSLCAQIAQLALYRNDVPRPSPWESLCDEGICVMSVVGFVTTALAALPLRPSIAVDRAADRRLEQGTVRPTSRNTPQAGRMS